MTPRGVTNVLSGLQTQKKKKKNGDSLGTETRLTFWTGYTIIILYSVQRTLALGLVKIMSAVVANPFSTKRQDNQESVGGYSWAVDENQVALSILCLMVPPSCPRIAKQ